MLVSNLTNDIDIVWAAERFTLKAGEALLQEVSELDDDAEKYLASKLDGIEYKSESGKKSSKNSDDK